MRPGQRLQSGRGPGTSCFEELRVSQHVGKKFEFWLHLVFFWIVFIWFYMVFIWFYMVFIWFYMVFIWFYIVFIWLILFLYDFIRFYIIFGGLTSIFGWPVFLNLNVFPDFERSTGNSDYHRNFPMTLFLTINVWPDS